MQSGPRVKLLALHIKGVDRPKCPQFVLMQHKFTVVRFLYVFNNYRFWQEAVHDEDERSLEAVEDCEEIQENHSSLLLKEETAENPHAPENTQLSHGGHGKTPEMYKNWEFIRANLSLLIRTNAASVRTWSCADWRDLGWGWRTFRPVSRPLRWRRSCWGWWWCRRVRRNSRWNLPRERANSWNAQWTSNDTDLRCEIIVGLKRNTHCRSVPYPRG